jgi:hypothetical protein
VSAKTRADRNATADRLPDGLDASHLRGAAGIRKHASLLGLAVLAIAMAFALTGLAGVEETRTDESEVATVRWHAPARIRNGEFFEMRLGVEAHEAIDELVVRVEASLWEDFTVNTFFPAATEETSEDGELRFTFGRVDAGTSFLMKVDAQINPDMLWRNEGVVSVYDGDEPIARVPVVIEVLP